MINLLISLMLLFAPPLVAMDLLEAVQPAPEATVASFQFGGRQRRDLDQRRVYEAGQQRPDFSGPLLDGSLVSITLKADTQPALDVAQNLFLAVYKNRPSLKIFNPLQLFRKTIPGFNALVEMGGPLYDNFDVIQDMWSLMQDDRINNYRHTGQIFQHLLLSGMLINPEWIEYFYMCLEEFEKIAAPGFMQALMETKIPGTAKKRIVYGRQVEDPKTGVTIGELLNMLRYQNEAPDAVANSKLPQQLASGMKTALAAYNMISDKVPELPLMQIPLRPEDRHRSLKVLPARPERRQRFIPMQLIFFQACYMGNLDEVRDFIKKYPSLINRQNEEGMTPLFVAALGAIHGKTNAIKSACTTVFDYLLERGANPDAIMLASRGTVRHFLTQGLDEFDEKYDELLKLVAKRDTFLKELVAHLAPVEAGKARPAAPSFADAATIAEVDGCLKRADLRGIMDHLAQTPRLKYLIDENGMSLLHKTASLLLTDFIQVLREERAKMTVRYQGMTDEQLQYLYVEEKAVVSKKGQPKKLVKPLYLQAEPLFWKFAQNTPVHNLGTVWSYLLNAGVPVDLKDKEGRTAADYFILIEDMLKELASAGEGFRIYRQIDAQRKRLLNPLSIQAPGDEKKADAEVKIIKETLTEAEVQYAKENWAEFEIPDALKSVWIALVRAPFLALQLTVRGQGLASTKAAADRRAITRGIREPEEVPAITNPNAPKQIEFKGTAPAAAALPVVPNESRDSDDDSDSEGEEDKKGCVIS